MRDFKYTEDCCLNNKHRELELNVSHNFNYKAFKCLWKLVEICLSLGYLWSSLFEFDQSERPTKKQRNKGVMCNLHNPLNCSIFNMSRGLIQRAPTWEARQDLLTVHYDKVKLHSQSLHKHDIVCSDVPGPSTDFKLILFLLPLHFSISVFRW